MIDIKLLRESPKSVREALGRRRVAVDATLDLILELDQRRRGILQTVEKLKAKRNTASSEVAARKKDGKDASELLGKLKQTSQDIKSQDAELKSVEVELRDALLRVPNVPLAEIPDGDESSNKVIRTWGEHPSFDFEPKAHWDLGADLGIIDLPRGAKIAGSGFPVFTGQGARFVRVLKNFMLDLHTEEHGYTEVLPPHLVNADSAFATGQLPDLEQDMYVTGDGLYLIPTAEVPITNLHRDELLSEDELPKTYVASTPCYRREAGSHGKDTRGIIRVHQFDKVELVRFCRPSDSRSELDLLLSHATAVLEKLDIPYRVVVLAAGDIGFSSAMTYDLEVWAAGVGGYLEVSSASTFTDYQARRANIRYRTAGGGKPEFVHTLNASGVALPRTIISLIENNQLADGRVRVPEVLVPYFGSEFIADGVG
ncbi:MAG: serine--tRNA ligase [Gemmatimonadetes bacterium]|nr:serine--tRNA ligase [Gemmatimonadota bacterium]